MLRITHHRAYEVPMVMRALDILEFLRRTNLALKMDEIAAQTNTSRTSTYRIIRTLVIRGYLSESLNGQYRFNTLNPVLTPSFEEECFSQANSQEGEILVAVSNLLRDTARRLQANKTP